MPANPRWYPNELPALTQSTSSSSALETAVRSLQNDARTQSIRQALSRRSAGIIAAAEQNRGSIVIGSLMPLVIDPVVRSQPATQTASAVGTVGYVAGGASTESASRTVDKITFSTDAVSVATGQLSFGRKQRGSASRLTSGFYAGGGLATDSSNGRGEIEEFIYTTETSTTLAAELPFTALPFSGGFGGRRSPTGFSSTQNAYFVESGTTAPNSVCRIGFESKATALLPSFVQPPIMFGAAVSFPSNAVIFPNTFIAGHGGALGVLLFNLSTESLSQNSGPQDTTGTSRQVLGNGVSAWVFGGREANPTFNYRYTPSTATYTKTTANLPTPLANAARVGSATAGYLCGGTSGYYHYWNSWFTSTGVQAVYKFVFATESLTVSPNSLTISRSHATGVSNFAGAFS